MTLHRRHDLHQNSFAWWTAFRPAWVMTLIDEWPLFGLGLVTPMLTLRVPSDEDLAQLIQLALAGIHPPETMPFSVPWTDLRPPLFQRNFLQHHWRGRADFAHDRFDLNFVVIIEGSIVGSQSLHRRLPSTTVSFETGSWLGRVHQGRNVGKVMRAAVVAFAFDYLQADVITSSAFIDNIASQRVSVATGYQLLRTEMVSRRGVDTAQLHYELRRDQWERTGICELIEVTGWPACQSMFSP